KITPKLEQYIFGLLDHHGLPDPNDPEWSSQANIEEIIQAQSGCEKTQAREHARRLIDLWQAGKARKTGKRISLHFPLFRSGNFLIRASFCHHLRWRVGRVREAAPTASAPTATTRARTLPQDFNTRGGCNSRRQHR